MGIQIKKGKSHKVPLRFHCEEAISSFYKVFAYIKYPSILSWNEDTREFSKSPVCKMWYCGLCLTVAVIISGFVNIQAASTHPEVANVNLGFALVITGSSALSVGLYLAIYGESISRSLSTMKRVLEKEDRVYHYASHKGKDCTCCHQPARWQKISQAMFVMMPSLFTLEVFGSGLLVYMNLDPFHALGRLVLAQTLGDDDCDSTGTELAFLLVRHALFQIVAFTTVRSHFLIVSTLFLWIEMQAVHMDRPVIASPAQSRYYYVCDTIFGAVLATWETLLFKWTEILMTMNMAVISGSTLILLRKFDPTTFTIVATSIPILAMGDTLVLSMTVPCIVASNLEMEEISKEEDW